MATKPETPAPAPEPEPEPAVEVEPDNGHPIGVYIGHGVESTWIGDHEWAVDPATGTITGRL